MIWLVPLVCAVAGLGLLAWFAHNVRREIEPTASAMERFAREHRLALARVRRTTGAARRRIDER